MLEIIGIRPASGQRVEMFIKCIFRKTDPGVQSAQNEGICNKVAENKKNVSTILFLIPFCMWLEKGITSRYKGKSRFKKNCVVLFSCIFLCN